MIASLSGILKDSGLTEVIVDVGGVGYLVFIPLSTYDRMPKQGQKVDLLIHTNVKEDDIQLYGFASADEKKLFVLLNSVSGIGPKLALNVLSSMTVSSFCSAIANADIKMLGRISGIGKKTAERMILELRTKVRSISPEVQFAHKVPETSAKNAEDAVLALEQLGFKYELAVKTVHELLNTLPEAERGTENLIRIALKNLNS